LGHPEEKGRGQTIKVMTTKFWIDAKGNKYPADGLTELPLVPLSLVETTGKAAIDDHASALAAIVQLTAERDQARAEAELVRSWWKQAEGQVADLLELLHKAQPIVWQWEHGVYHGKTELADAIARAEKESK
jgi:hypothetical protein